MAGHNYREYFALLFCNFFFFSYENRVVSANAVEKLLRIFPDGFLSDYDRFEFMYRGEES